MGHPPDISFMYGLGLFDIFYNLFPRWSDRDVGSSLNPESRCHLARRRQAGRKTMRSCRERAGVGARKLEINKHQGLRLRLLAAGTLAVTAALAIGPAAAEPPSPARSEEHTSELQSRRDLV